MSTQTVSLPTTTLNIVGANTTSQNAAQKILFVGQKEASGTATALALTEDVTELQINTLFGARSMLAQMLRAAKAINKVTKMDVIALDDDGGGTPADGTFTITGPATEDGTLVFSVGSYINNKYTIAVTSGDSATVIGDALEAAITADTGAPFTAANVVGVVTVTASNDGTEGNFIGFKVEGVVAGVAVALTAMASGATNPSLSTVFAAVAGIRYQTIVFPVSYGLVELKAFLSPRFNVDNKVLDGIAILSDTDTKANLVSTYTSENEQLLVVHGNAKIDNADFKGSVVNELDVVISSQFAAIRALRLTPDVSIASLVVAGSNGPRDTFGGDAIRSLPYFNTPYANLPLVNTGLGFTDSEISDLKDEGLFVLGNNIAGNTLISGEVPTLYKTDAAGNADVSYKFLNYVDTISGIREYYFNNYKSRYAQTRLTEGNILKGRNMANEISIRGFSARLYNDLSLEDFVLVQNGEVAAKFYKDNLDVSLDLSVGKVTINMITPIVTQLRIILGTIQIAFSTN